MATFFQLQRLNCIPDLQESTEKILKSTFRAPIGKQQKVDFQFEGNLTLSDDIVLLKNIEIDGRRNVQWHSLLISFESLSKLCLRKLPQRNNISIVYASKRVRQGALYFKYVFCSFVLRKEARNSSNIQYLQCENHLGQVSLFCVVVSTEGPEFFETPLIVEHIQQHLATYIHIHYRQ